MNPRGEYRQRRRISAGPNSSAFGARLTGDLKFGGMTRMELATRLMECERCGPNAVEHLWNTAGLPMFRVI